MENELLKSIHKIYENDRTTVYAADDVFITVVGMAASDVEGVLSLSDLNTGEICLKPTVRNLSKCLRFDFSSDQITVLIGIVVEAGSNLLAVSTAVQNKVLNAVRDIIGCTLSRVNIQISDVRSK
ncbi:MAG: Asp23/Gls24 family envelope stress response protein [Lachnospiraceae bacterium]|nr:Asp23/Gls24 family envelope stress response protein [Lachnospiraceae bacterium]